MSSTNRTLLIHERHEEPEFRRVHMKWVTVIDTQGNRRPQIHWWTN